MTGGRREHEWQRPDDYEEKGRRPQHVDRPKPPPPAGSGAGNPPPAEPDDE